jgi:uncharacterized protein YdhG (YjbR/CyaY superfamily)
MSHWFAVMKEIADLKYREQIAYLRENHGFSQAHANALVSFSRGSTSSKRYATFDEYLATLDDTKRATMEAIFAAVTAAFRGSEIVIAWNQPMVKKDGRYLFGASAVSAHILLAPWGGVPESMRERLAGFQVLKKTIRVPVDWKVDRKLLKDLINAAQAGG